MNAAVEVTFRERMRELGGVMKGVLETALAKVRLPAYQVSSLFDPNFEGQMVAAKACLESFLQSGEQVAVPPSLAEHLSVVRKACGVTLQHLVDSSQGFSNFSGIKPKIQPVLALQLVIDFGLIDEAKKAVDDIFLA